MRVYPEELVCFALVNVPGDMPFVDLRNPYSGVRIGGPQSCLGT